MSEWKTRITKVQVVKPRVETGEACLVLVYPPGADMGKRFPLARNEVVLGRGSDCDIHVDITDMTDSPDGRFDVLNACDVLEHILDEAAALREIRRVLRPGGAAILTVPQVDADVATYEDLSIVSREARSAAYGQEDHVRLYGNDFPDRLQAAGFNVTTIDASRFDGALVDRHVLVAPVPNPPPFDFNWRRVFIARVTA